MSAARARLAGVVGAAVLSLGLTLGLTGCGMAAGPWASAADGPNLTSPIVTGAPVAPAAPLAAAAPVGLRIDSINASSTLVPLGLNANRTVAVPPVSTPLQASWYRLGPAPGAPGPAVILGHVNGDGKEGIFARLNEVKPGDQVKVSRADGKTAVFTVTKLQQVAKNAFPTTAVYGDTPAAELRLVTCGGDFDQSKHSYADSIIAFATLTSVA
ncbi:class F sortase [Pseudonocardia sp. Cha107L01]|uniref:class F sortase n=1 Tax=Pseudonocardia sp. Cha107L01 TaxID=3457576 RepID=UPI00403E4147